MGRFSCWRPIPKADFFTANSVLAPVVVDAKTPEGVHAFPSYVDTLSRHNNAEIAEVEARGCKPYFSSMRRIRDRSPSKAAARTNKLGEKMPDGSMYLGQSSAEGVYEKNTSTDRYWSSTSQGEAWPMYQRRTARSGPEGGSGRTHFPPDQRRYPPRGIGGCRCIKNARAKNAVRTNNQDFAFRSASFRDFSHGDFLSRW